MIETMVFAPSILIMMAMYTTWMMTKSQFIGRESIIILFNGFIIQANNTLSINQVHLLLNHNP